MEEAILKSFDWFLNRIRFKWTKFLILKSKIRFLAAALAACSSSQYHVVVVVLVLVLVLVLVVPELLSNF